MFRGIGRFSVNRPWLVIVLWLVATAALIALAPQLKPTNDQAEFLPSDYESVRAVQVQQDAFPQSRQPSAIGVFQRTDGGELTDADKKAVGEVAAGLQEKKFAKITEVVADPSSVSPDGKISLIHVFASTKTAHDETLVASIGKLRTEASELLPDSGLKLGFTGASPMVLDSQEASDSTDAMVMMATLVLIIVLLLIIFRSPVIALMPVLIIAVVFMVTMGVIATASELAGLEAPASISAILIVVLFGVGTDYTLFLLFRYREHLREGQQPKEALATAAGRVGETIASAAGVVIAAFLSLLLSSMGMLSSMGLSLALAVAVTLVAALTLVPAVFSLLGIKAFWPSKAWRTKPDNRITGRVGDFAARKPALIAAVSGGLLVVMALGVLGFKAEYDTESSLPGDLESVQAMEQLQQGFSAGQSDPTFVYVKSTDGSPLDQDRLAVFGTELSGVEGVDKVSPAQVNPKGDVAQYSVVLKFRPTGDEALSLVGGELRDTVHEAAPEGTEQYVGGSTAVLADVRTAVNRDYKLVFPVAAVAIMLILGLMLRSLIAPLYLMISVGLGFGGTLGATVWLFQDGSGGLLFMLPVIVYLFVVAIGTDYNILMVARLREEIQNGRRPEEAVRLAVVQSAPTIGAAAVILAGTFGVLMLADNDMLKQMGFAVAFGIMLSAFVMAILLVPAITTLVGRSAWWPGNRHNAPADDATGPARAEEADPLVTTRTS
ncbi:MMPL family transporter [Streptomyces sp. ISL-112]|uniref:MMPL family transporter n=1 Tax=unclassified Streptomyces TaxID=2593676 RepID=UPI001BEC9BB4|nr:MULTISPECIES: MMPL family transporter [unclassified Streptomyces]MBT2430526.1 MMPL family transporter [Streptomyces sp. ISL-112]MBT2461807.1 MMPL family transporter [Streptomyces sp. ISL-63]